MTIKPQSPLQLLLEYFMKSVIEDIVTSIAVKIYLCIFYDHNPCNPE